MNLPNLTRAIDLEASFVLLRCDGDQYESRGRAAKQTFLRTRIDEERALHYWNTGRREDFPNSED